MKKLSLAMAAVLALLRVGFVCVCGSGAGILGTGWAAAEDLAPEQASAFVVGKLFSYTCFEGTAGIGRIFPDGSVVGTIRIRGEGETRFAALSPGTIRVDGPAICAHLSGLLITPVLQGAEDRQSQLPRLSRWIGLRLLRLLSAQSAHAPRQQPGQDPDSDAPAVDATVVSRVIYACDWIRNYRSDARRLHAGDACTRDSSRLERAR